MRADFGNPHAHASNILTSTPVVDAEAAHVASVLGIAISAAFNIPPGTFVRFAVATAAATSARPTSSSPTSSSATPGLRPERSPRLAQPLARPKTPATLWIWSRLPRLMLEILTVAC